MKNKFEINPIFFSFSFIFFQFTWIRKRFVIYRITIILFFSISFLMIILFCFYEQFYEADKVTKYIMLLYQYNNKKKKQKKNR